MVVPCVAGRFAPSVEVGRGGMGAVFRADDLARGVPVALKILHAGHDARRFERETAALASLAHPGIVGYVAHGAEPDGTAWIAMEWVEGESLEARLGRGPLRVDEAVALVGAAAAAIAAAHAAGVVHRDLKPANLLLEGGDPARVRVIDFGIAAAAAAARATATGTALGTPAYMAPEQARGEAAHAPALDVWALGAVLHECLAGEPPFDGETPVAILAKVLFAEPARLSERVEGVPPELERIVARCLARDPAARFPTAGALAEALAAAPRPALTARRLVAAPTETARAAFTGAEQRVVSVIVVRRGDALDPDATLGVDELARLRAVPAALGLPEDALDGGPDAGVSLSAIEGGLWVVVVRDPGAAPTRAVELARRLVEHVGGAAAIATGRAEVRAGGALGWAIERAVQLLDALGGGARGVHVEETTARLVRGRHALAPLEGLEPPAYRVGAPAAGAGGEPGAFVGRDGELAALEESFAACVARREGALHWIQGPAGAGKSRLVAELLRRASGRRPAPRVLRAHASFVGQGSPYGLAAELVRDALPPSGDPRAGLRAWVEATVPPARAPRVARFLAELVGWPAPGDDAELAAARRDPAIMGDQLRRAFLDALEGLAGAAPGGLVLVLDDLQWGDVPSLRLIAAALGVLADAPLFVLAGARAEPGEGGPRRTLFELFADRAPRLLELAPMSDDASAALVRGALDGAPDALVRRIVERAAGNAFFLEELVRAAARGGGDAELPATIVALVQARLDALDRAARLVVRAASVFGGSFTEAGVAALLEGAAPAMLQTAPRSPSDPRGGIGAVLDELVASEVLVRAGSALAFRHTFLREGAYATLTDADRAAGHRLAARHLAASGAAQPLVVAEHHELAGEPSRALEWYVRAALSALEGNDWDAAIARARRASGDPSAPKPVRGAALRVEADALRWKGAFADAEKRAVQALTLLERGTPPWVACVLARANALGELGRTDRLEAIAEDLGYALATEEEAAGGDPAAAAGLVRAAAGVAHYLLHAGRYGPADELIAACDRVASRLPPEPALEARLQHTKALRAVHAGRPAETLERALRSVAAYEEIGDARSACLMSVNAGYGLGLLGRHEEAEQLLRAALETARKLGLRAAIFSATENLGWIRAELGALDEAAALEREAIEGFRATGMPRMEGAARSYLAAILLERGDAAAAADEAARAGKLLESTPPLLAPALATLAAALLAGAGPGATGPLAQADEASARAMGILEELGALEDGEASVRLVRAQVLRARGDLDGARALLAVARARLEQRAASIADGAARGVFLERVRAHRRLLAEG